MTIKFPALVLISSTALALATAGVLRAQAPTGKTTNDGVFTDAQAREAATSTSNSAPRATMPS